MALRGNYNEIIKDAKDREDEIVKLLENEIASLYMYLLIKIKNVFSK